MPLHAAYGSVGEPYGVDGGTHSPELAAGAPICNFLIVVVAVVAVLPHLIIMGREEEALEEEVTEEIEVVDPKVEIEDSCKPRCVKQLISYEACVKRIEEDENGRKHCTGQYFDYWGCIDQCTAPKVFRRLT